MPAQPRGGVGALFSNMQGTVGTADAHSAELVLATGERLAGVNFNRTQPGGVAAVRYAN